MSDMVELPMLNKPELIADFLEVTASTQYHVGSDRTLDLRIARELIACRREIEMEVLPAMLAPAPQPVPEVRDDGPFAHGDRGVPGILLLRPAPAAGRQQHGARRHAAGGRRPLEEAGALKPS